MRCHIQLYIYIYTYMCMCVCVYVCMYVCTHLYMYVLYVLYVLYVRMYVCMYVCICICVYCMYVCMYACMHVCMYVNVCMYVCNYFSLYDMYDLCINTHTCTCTCARTHLCTIFPSLATSRCACGLMIVVALTIHDLGLLEVLGAQASHLDALAPVIWEPFGTSVSKRCKGSDIWNARSAKLEILPSRGGSQR